MVQRVFDRTPGRVQVQYRSAKALLVAYTINLSRGGMFLECDELPAKGTVLDLDIFMESQAISAVTGVVAWHRTKGSEAGPRGIGIHFDAVDEALGALIDRLIASFSGISIVLQAAADSQHSLSRMLRSIVGTAEVIVADDSDSASALLGTDTDLLVVEANPKDAQTTLAAAHTANQIPCIALVDADELIAPMRAAGANEVLMNPPSSNALRNAVMRLLASPRPIRAPTDDDSSHPP